MTREELARKIRWSAIIWVIGLVNVGAMIPQLAEIIRTRNVEGLAVGMFVIYLVVQVALTLEGFFKRNTMLMVCFGLSASITLTIISLVIWLRYFA